MPPDPTNADLTAPLARRNPVAKLAAGIGLTFCLLATLDPVAPAVAIVVELLVVPRFGLRYRDLARRGWPLLTAVVSVVTSLILFGTNRTGTILLPLGPISVTTGLLDSALGLGLRLLAISLPGVLVFATTDATDLADALVQNLRAPARFAIGSLAAFRLMPLLGDEWRLLTLARRARGLDAGANPVARLRLFGSTTFGLLVGAIRRATRLAAAMDARGFDSGLPRTSARVQPFGLADAALIVGALVVGAAAIAISVYCGTFQPLLA